MKEKHIKHNLSLLERHSHGSASFLAGFTLMELLVSITLIGMILVTLTAIDIASRNFLKTSDYEARIQNEISPIVGMIAKNITTAYGFTLSPGLVYPFSCITPPCPEIEIRQLDNPSAPWVPSYEDYSDDDWVAYRYNSATYTIAMENCLNNGAGPLFRCNNNWGPQQILARNITACNFTIAPDASGVFISVTAMRNATAGESVTNPAVVLNTTVAAR